MHEDIDFGSKTYHIGENFDRYEALGIKVHITEFDVKGKGGWSQANLAKQADVYYKVLDVCLHHANCESFETWGINDKYTWLKAPANPLPRDKNNKEKAAYWAMRDLLKNFDRNDPAVKKRNQRKAADA